MANQATGAFKCPRCGATTLGDYDNCPECGLSLRIVCPECGHAWRYWEADYEFCPKCGTRIEQEQAVR